MASQWDIKGQTCLITGGASGIGAVCVEAFLRQGAKFVSILDIDEVNGTAIAEKLGKIYPGNVGFVKCDVSNEESITAAFNAVVGQVKHLDIVINNAGILNDSENFWRISCDVNLLGVISFSLKAVKHMRKDQGGAGGTIINVSSVAAFCLSPSIPIYCANKAAVIHFSRCLSNEPFYSITGVRVLTICFGGTATPILQALSEHVVDPLHAQAIVNDFNSTKWQRPESAAAACITMIRNGANGSVWLSQQDAPVEDITPTIARAFDLMTSLVIQD